MKLAFIYMALFILGSSSFADCKKDRDILSIKGHVVTLETEAYFLYGYYAIAPKPSLDFLWECTKGEILGLPVIKAQNSMEDMLKKGFEISPTSLSPKDITDMWNKRLALPIAAVSFPQDIYHYKLVSGKIIERRKNSRSYWIDILLDDKTKLSLYIPKAYFPLFDFKQKNFEKGELIHAIGLIEAWRTDFVIQISHPHQIAGLQKLK